MRLKTTHRPKVGFDMSSATDIIFLLLIFFILSSNSIFQKNLELDLPSSKNNSEAISTLEICISSDLKVHLGEDVIDKSDLKSFLETSFKQGKRQLLIFSDRSVPIEYVVFVIDQAVSLGMKTSIATSDVEDGGS